MNCVALMGYITGDPELVRRKVGESKYIFAEFTLAIPRMYRKENSVTADFVRIKASGKQAEFVERYMKKGRRIAVTGSIETSSFINKKRERQMVTRVMAKTIDFADDKHNPENDVDTGSYITSNIDVSALEGAEFYTESQEQE